MPISVPQITIRQFIARIRRLKADRPQLRAGIWYLTQTEHWLGWLGEHNTRGAYGCVPSPNRDARFAYYHVVNPQMLLWLGKSASLSPALIVKVRRTYGAHRMMQRQSGGRRGSSCRGRWWRE